MVTTAVPESRERASSAAVWATYAASVTLVLSAVAVMVLLGVFGWLVVWKDETIALVSNWEGFGGGGGGWELSRPFAVLLAAVSIALLATWLGAALSMTPQAHHAAETATPVAAPADAGD